MGLTFIADYRGATVAVDEDSGSLYRDMIDLTVNWNNADGGGALTSSITGLRGVSGTWAYFRHDDKDVRTIFFSGPAGSSGVTVGTNGSFDASNATVDIGYREGPQEAGVSNAGNFDGVFVGDSHNEGPLGVLGRWRIGEQINFQGSFGADLQPWEGTMRGGPVEGPPASTGRSTRSEAPSNRLLPPQSFAYFVHLG